MGKIVINSDKDIASNIVINGYEKECLRLMHFLSDRGERFHLDENTGNYYINSFFPYFPSKAWNRFIYANNEIVKNNKRIPLQADIVITGKCHCRCWHCFRIKDRRTDLSLEEIKRVIDDLYECGTCTVGITGGEPMLRQDIKEIIGYIPEGMQGQLYTTGHNIDEDFADYIKNSNVSRVIISLDHYDKKVSCEMRNYNNAYDEAINAVKLFVERGVYTAITVCITENLLGEGKLEKYFEHVSSLHPDEIRVIMPIPQGNLEGKDVSRIYADAVKFVKEQKLKYFNNKEYPSILNFCEFESAFCMGCSAGANYISINNDGLVTPCVAVPLSFGNIKKQQLKEIFESMEKYFPRSSRICYGKISGRVIDKLDINTDITPLEPEISKKIAEKCNTSQKRASIFECFE